MEEGRAVAVDALDVARTEVCEAHAATRVRDDDLAGVEVAVLMLELGPRETKVSLRSRSPVDVNEVAGLFGGGGHKAAAGVRFPGPLAEAEPAVLEAVKQAMQ